MDSFNDVWQAVLDYIRSKVNETAYNLWIKIDYKKIYADSRNPSRTQDMHPEGVSDNNFLIEPPRQFPRPGHTLPASARANRVR